MEEEKQKKSRGAPKGNRNACKHGFYSKVLDKKEQLDYKQAVEVEGLDEEIATFRVKLKSLLEKDPENIKLITHATNALIRLVIAKYNISKDVKPGFKEATVNVLREIGVPLGIGIGSALLK
jgi:hypothetical protein